MIPVLILGVPIFDTTLVTISRLRRGLIPFTSAGKDHTAHRLANRSAELTAKPGVGPAYRAIEITATVAKPACAGWFRLEISRRRATSQRLVRFQPPF